MWFACSHGAPEHVFYFLFFFINAAQSAVKKTFLASAIRKCGGNEEKGGQLYNAYGSNGQVCCLYTGHYGQLQKTSFFLDIWRRNPCDDELLLVLLHVMLKMICNSGACLISNLEGQMLKSQIQKVESRFGIKQVSRKWRINSNPWDLALARYLLFLFFMSDLHPWKLLSSFH